MRKIVPVPSREFLCSVLAYTPETGALVWRMRGETHFDGKHAGKAAGTLTMGRSDGSNRYLAVGITIDGAYRQHIAHRLIWMIMTGEQPPHMIDHRDGDELNLRWDNLRAATPEQNLQNSKRRKDNTSGVKGVHWDEGHRKWRAVITANKKHFRLGRYDTVAEAAAIIEIERIRLHGEFARFE